MVDIEIREARPHELSLAAALLSRGMRDNPLHMSVFGPEPQQRERARKSLLIKVKRIKK